MDINVSVYSKQDAAAVAGNLQAFELPVWNVHKFIDVAFEDYLLLIASNGSQIVGVWYLPLAEGRITRKHRTLPYMSPSLFERSRLHRRNIVIKMIEALQERVISIDLPLSPDFTDANASFVRGCFTEWRHTHRIAKQTWQHAGPLQFDEKTRNHIRKAKQTVSVQFSTDAGPFDFSQAIRGTQESIAARAEFAKMLLNERSANVGIATDTSTGKVLGGVFLVKSVDTMMLYHSWFERESVRGIPSLLIEQAIEFSFQAPGIEHFDFEGSILASVDAFMSGFNAEIVPYAYLYWSRNQSEVADFVRSSLNIQGRSET